MNVYNVLVNISTVSKIYSNPSFLLKLNPQCRVFLKHLFEMTDKNGDNLIFLNVL